jgi:hypothetical protein
MPCGSECPAVTGRQTPSVNPVRAEKQLWHDDVHAVLQHMPETQFIDPQSVETWQAAPSAREPWACAARAAKANATSAQAPVRPKRTARDALPAFINQILARPRRSSIGGFRPRLTHLVGRIASVADFALPV